MSIHTVLILGADPRAAQPAGGEKLRPGSAEEILASLDRQIARLEEMGVRPSMCLIAPTEQSATEVRATLSDSRFDLISIGNGVHVIPSFLPTFEVVMNDIHRLARGSLLCFSTGPDTVYDSVVRKIGECARDG